MNKFPCICEFCKYSKVDYDFVYHSYRLFCDNYYVSDIAPKAVEPDDGCNLFEDKYDYLVNRAAFQ